MDALERAREIAASWDERVRAGLPAELDIFDAHTHLGNDIDGMVGVYDELVGGMDRYGVSRANMFCLDEPDRGPAFPTGMTAPSSSPRAPKAGSSPSSGST